MGEERDAELPGPLQHTTLPAIPHPHPMITSQEAPQTPFFRGFYGCSIK